MVAIAAAAALGTVAGIAAGPAVPARGAAEVAVELQNGDIARVADVPIGCRVSRRGIPPATMLDCRRAGALAGTYGVLFGRSKVRVGAFQLRTRGTGCLHRDARRRRRLLHRIARAMTPTPETTPSLISAGDRRRTRLAAEGGRISLVVLSVVAVYAAGRGLDAEAAVVAAILAAAWLAALQFARFACPSALGPGLATGVGTVVGLAIVALTPLWLPSVELAPARALAMALAILAFVGVWESVVQHTTSARRQVLVVGSPSAAEAVAKATSHEHAALDILGVVPDRPEEIVSCDVPVLGRLEGLEELIAALQPDVIVVADEVECETAVDRLLDVPISCFRVVGFTSFFEHVLGRVPI